MKKSGVVANYAKRLHYTRYLSGEESFPLKEQNLEYIQGIIRLKII
jgi:hypothetical protein